MVPGLIENAGNKIDKVTEKRIAQVRSQGGKELKRVSPIILNKVIGQLQEISFRLISKFAHEKLCVKEIQYSEKKSTNKKSSSKDKRLIQSALYYLNEVKV